jgi:hypothetical protein
MHDVATQPESPEDMPEAGGRFVSRGQSAAAVAYVACGRSHSTARRSYRKLVREHSGS